MGIITKSPELQQRIVELHNLGFGSKSISKRLKEEGVSISHMTIERWLADWKMCGAPQFNKSKMNQLTNTQQEKTIVLDLLNVLIDQLKEEIEDGKVAREYKLRARKQMLDALKLKIGLLPKIGRFHPQGKQDSGINMIHQLKKQLNYLEAQGTITINNPKLRLDQNQFGGDTK